MKTIYLILQAKGTVKTNYFNGYGWTNNTKKFIEYLEDVKGLINGVDYSIENIRNPSKFKQRFTLIK